MVRILIGSYKLRQIELFEDLFKEKVRDQAGVSNTIIGPFAKPDIINFLRDIGIHKGLQFIDDRIAGIIGSFKPFQEIGLSVIETRGRSNVFHSFLFRDRFIRIRIKDTNRFTDTYIFGSIVICDFQEHIDLLNM